MKIKIQAATYDTCPRCKDRQKIHSYCKPCEKAYSSEWYQKNKEKTLAKNKRNSQKILEWLQNYKAEHGCHECGYNEHSCALDFHHVDESKKDFALNLAQRKRYGMERIRKEVAKCIVLCANCHRVHHHKKEEDAPCHQEDEG